MPKRLSGGNLSQMLVIFLPLLRVLNTKAVGKDLANGLQGHSLALRIAEHYEHPTDRADAAIESERTARSHAFHHAEERRGNDNVRRPARDCVLAGLLAI